MLHLETILHLKQMSMILWCAGLVRNNERGEFSQLVPFGAGHDIFQKVSRRRKRSCIGLSSWLIGI